MGPAYSGVLCKDMLGHLGLQLAFSAGNVISLYITDNGCWVELVVVMLSSVDPEGADTVVLGGPEDVSGHLLLLVQGG